MKKIFFAITHLLLIVSCRNNAVFEENCSVEQQRKVSPCIEDAFFYYLEYDNDSADTSFIYSMDFLKGVPGGSTEDTMIVFYRMNENMPTNGLRGLITIGNFKLLVFDEQKIGESYYNVDSLKGIDLGECRLSTDDISVGCSFIIGDSCLDVWGVQPDDYEPIKIR